MYGIQNGYQSERSTTPTQKSKVNILKASKSMERGPLKGKVKSRKNKDNEGSPDSNIISNIQIVPQKDEPMFSPEFTNPVILN